MATTKRNKGGRATATRAKSTARPRTTPKVKAKAKAAAKPVAKAKAVAKAKPIAKAKPAVGAKRSAPARAAAPKKPGGDHPEVVAAKARFQRERNGFEKRLTEAVREIGMLRHHELRAMQFERQLAERDVTIGRLQTQLSELERRTAEPIYVREVQQSLALSSPSVVLDDSAPDLDEFEDDRLADDADLATDDD